MSHHTWPLNIPSNSTVDSMAITNATMAADPASAVMSPRPGARNTTLRVSLLAAKGAKRPSVAK
jgi:hypothetical protein